MVMKGDHAQGEGSLVGHYQHQLRYTTLEDPPQATVSNQPDALLILYTIPLLARLYCGFCFDTVSTCEM